MKVRRIDYSADEFLVGTRSLTDAECGIYWRACSLIYSHGGAIPIDELRRWCSSRKKDFEGIVAALVASGKLTRNGDEISQTRAQRELERATSRAEKWRKNGANGGRPISENKEIQKPSGFNENNRASNHQLSTINHQLPPSSEGGQRARARAIADEMFAIWREECGDVLNNPTKASENRITQCSARLRDLGGMDEWRELCRRIRRSRYLTEKWKATIDWVLELRNMLKIQEGNYDDRNGGAGGKSDLFAERQQAALDDRERGKAIGRAALLARQMAAARDSPGVGAGGAPVIDIVPARVDPGDGGADFGRA